MLQRDYGQYTSVNAVCLLYFVRRGGLQRREACFYVCNSSVHMESEGANPGRCW